MDSWISGFQMLDSHTKLLKYYSHLKQPTYLLRMKHLAQLTCPSLGPLIIKAAHAEFPI